MKGNQAVAIGLRYLDQYPLDNVVRTGGPENSDEAIARSNMLSLVLGAM